MNDPLMPWTFVLLPRMNEVCCFRWIRGWIAPAMVERTVLITFLLLTLLSPEAHGEAPDSTETSRHILRLLLNAEAPLRACLAEEVSEGEQLPDRVLTRLEFPSGSAPRVLTIDVWPGSAVDRCVRQALSTLSVPTYEGALERHECLIPLGQGTLQCRQHQSDRSQTSPPPPAPRSPAAQRSDRSDDEEADGEPDERSPSPQLRKNSVTLNPLGAVVGGVDLKYTRALRHSSIGAAVAIQLPLRLDALGVLGFVEVLGWINDEPLSGFYGGVAIQVGGSFGPPDIVQVGPLAVVGVRWNFNSGFTLGMSGSFGAVFFFADCPGTCSAQTVTGAMRLDENGRGSAFTARLAFDVGIRF